MILSFDHMVSDDGVERLHVHVPAGDDGGDGATKGDVHVHLARKPVSARMNGTPMIRHNSGRGTATNPS